MFLGMMKAILSACLGYYLVSVDILLPYYVHYILLLLDFVSLPLCCHSAVINVLISRRAYFERHLNPWSFVDCFHVLRT